MVISHSKKFIFIHNYKVAGTSIENALTRYSNKSFWKSGIKDQLRFLLNVYPSVFSSDFHGHVTAAELKKSVPEELFNNYFKFGFVRDPWDWQVSLYSYMLKMETHHQHHLVKSMKDFDEYIEWRVNEDCHLQKEFFYDADGECLVDYVGKFENINSSAHELFEMFRLNTTIPHLNKSRSDNHYIHYYSQKSIDLIAEAYKEDLSTFGYCKPEVLAYSKTAS